MLSKMKKLGLEINLHSSREEVVRDWEIVERWGLEQSLSGSGCGCSCLSGFCDLGEGCPEPWAGHALALGSKFWEEGWAKEEV